MVVGTCDYSIWEVEAGRPGIQGRSRLPRELEASAGLPEACLKERRQDSEGPHCGATRWPVSGPRDPALSTAALYYGICEHHLYLRVRNSKIRRVVGKFQVNLHLRLTPTAAQQLF